MHQKIAAADADPDVDLRNQYASKCSCKSQTEQYKKGFVRGKTSQLKVVNWKKAVKWSSSNNKVVKVSSKGKITAVKTGTATVKARIAKKTLTCKVTVKARECQ